MAVLHIGDITQDGSIWTTFHAQGLKGYGFIMYDEYLILLVDNQINIQIISMC